MRPVERGKAPRAYSRYDQARDDLVQRLGRYCSYCERPVPSGIHIEHVLSSARHASQSNDWENFLLACPNCNGHKKDKPVDLAAIGLPHCDNTLRAFIYTPGGRVKASSQLPTEVQQKAQRLIDLVQLNHFPGDQVPKRSTRDDRLLDRLDAWNLAKRYAPIFAADFRGEEARCYIDIARKTGHFSIFWHHAAAHPTLRARLRAAFPGTAPDCFDVNGEPCPRPGGSC